MTTTTAAPTITDDQIRAWIEGAGRAGDLEACAVACIALGEDWSDLDVDPRSVTAYGGRIELRKLTADEARAEMAMMEADAQAMRDEQDYQTAQDDDDAQWAAERCGS